MGQKRYVLGVDFGSDSVRALVVDVENGQELASCVAEYPRWKKQLYCDPPGHRFRHHPLDYIESLTAAIQGSLTDFDDTQKQAICGIGVDTTGSTPIAVDEQGTALALLDEHKDNPNAMFVLWKDHTAIKEAAEITERCKNYHTDYTRYIGGLYSAEWFWAKALHVVREDPELAKEIYSWVELCDWIPALLSGTTAPAVMKRSRCAAGHKTLWHPSWGGLPDDPFLEGLNPKLVDIKAHLFTETLTSDNGAGQLSAEWAEKLGLREGITVAIGAFDCHMGAVGAGARPHELVKVIGTSTCDVMAVEPDVLGDKAVAGICGQVDGSILPGLIGLEAGQSAFGDVYAWFKRLLGWSYVQQGQDAPDDLLLTLTEAAERYQPELSSPLALDWFNGRRTPYANQVLNASMSGLNLSTGPVEIFHALVEATACGAQAIIECMETQGVTVGRVIGIGGIASKSSYVMQICADVFNRQVDVVASDQCCALGAAIFAAVADGQYDTVEQAQQKMASKIARSYVPRAEWTGFYSQRYALYRELAEYTEHSEHYKAALNDR